ncbi:MAG: glycosyltransferase family 87 protein [Gemmataceae bacterium]
MQEWAEKRRDWLAALAAAALVVASFGDRATVAAESPFGLKYDGGRLAYIRDFPAHVQFARSVWAGRRGDRSAYSPASHRRVMADWAGAANAGRALPFGYSPTMLYVLGPLTLLPDGWAFAAWTVLGWAAAWWVCRSASPLTALLILISPVAARSQALGQTALLTTAALVFLMLESRRERPRVLAMTVVLWALTAKPPLALTAGVALLALRQWRPVAYAVGLTAVTAAAVTPLLGAGWVGDYVTLVTRYNEVTGDPLFAWSIGPAYMSGLRSVLSLYVGVRDDVSSRVAGLLWLPALALVAWRGSWASAVLVMLLLAPHVNSTEDVALIVVAAASPLPLAALACVAAWATPGYSPPVGPLWPLPAFALKAALLVAVLATQRRAKITA